MTEINMPLTYTQESLWLLDKLSGPRVPVYNESLAFRMDGALDLEAFTEAVAHVFGRHETLRTVYTETSEGLRAVVRDQPPSVAETVELVDLRDRTVAEGAHAEGLQLLHDAYRRPFDLNRGPVIRAVVVRVTDVQTLFGLTTHHIAADGWSLEIMLGEISDRYRALTRGDEPPTAPAPRLSDFAARQRDEVHGGHLDGNIEASVDALREAPQLLTLPVDRPRPSMQTFRGATRRLTVGKERIKRLTELCARHSRSTDFTVLMSVYALLMHRLSGQEKVTVGTTLLNRADLDALRTVGCFVNTAALACDFQDEQLTFRQLLTRTGDQLVQLLRRQDTPFPTVLDRLEITRDPSHSPVFQTMLTMLGKRKNLRLGDEVASRPIDLERVASKYDLLLYVSEQDDTIQFEAEFSTDIFEPVSIDRILHRFVHMIDVLAEDLDVPVSQVAMLPEQERRLVVEEWNDTAVEFPDSTVIDDFEAQAARTPDAVAVEFHDTTLTYRQLDDRATRVARALVDDSVTGFVGVYMERSLEMVVALVAVVKAGFAYVPIDPDYPTDRVRYMVQDSGAALILTQERHRAALDGAGARVEVLTDLEARATSGRSAPTRTLTPNSRIYMIYTSGSTGRPKGVVNRHASVYNRLAWMQSQYPLTAADRVLQKTPFSFDVSVWEFFWPLMVGARIVVAEPGGHRDPEYLRDVIRSRHITTMHFVPSMLNVFLEQDGLREACDTLRRVFASGEALPHETVARFGASIGAELHNLYGPTEAAIDVSSWAATPDHPGRVVPIGRPVANTRLYVVDRHLRPQPVGVPGELCIAGVQLAEGYHNRPDLTGQAFVEGPFTDIPETRIYRTGDLARFLLDGQIEYLGRLDNQVKLHGLRIELGEIEAALLDLPEVHEAATVLHRAGTTQTLVAYLVAPDFDQHRAIAELKRHLPEFMVPQRYILLEAMPVSVNGKLDRKALPSPASVTDAGKADTHNVSEDPAQLPQTAEERLVAGVWQDVLGVDRVGLDSNFFHLGGDSIMSIRIAARLRESGRHVDVKDVFANTTVRGLAALLTMADRNVGTATGSDADVLARASRPFAALAPGDRVDLPDWVQDAWPLTRLQYGMLYHSLMHDCSPVYHDVFSYDFQAPFDRSRVLRALREVVGTYSQLRSRFDLSGYDEPLQLISAEVRPDLRFTDLSGLPEAEQERALARMTEDEKSRDFELEGGALIRYLVSVRGVDRFTLTLSFHHAILDGWSVAVLVEAFRRNYRDLVDGRELPTAPAPEAVPYGAFLALERQALGNPEHSRFWARAIEGLSPTLLGSGQRDAGATGAYASVSRVVPEDVVHALRRRTDRLGVPAKTAYLALHLTLLAQMTGRGDVMGGLVSHGRPETDGGDEAIGLFLNTLPFPLRAFNGDGGDFDRMLRRVFEFEQRAVAHRRYPLSEIIRGSGHDELFDVVFNYTDFHVYRDETDERVAISGVRYFEQTNFVAVVHVQREHFSGAMTLTVNHDAVRIAPHVVETYLDSFLVAAADPGVLRSPGTDTLTEDIRAIAAKALGVAQLSPDDDMIEHGIDSMTAIRIVAKIKRLGVHPTIQDLFSHPTARLLAAHLRAGSDGAEPTRSERDEHDGRRPFDLAGRPRDSFPPGIADAYQATAVQKDMIAYHDIDPVQAVYHDVFGYRLVLPLQEEALRHALQRLVDRHPALRTAFDRQARPEVLQLVHEHAAPSLRVTDLSGLDEPERQAGYDAWFETEKTLGFDWTTPPLMRFFAHRMTAGEFVLTLSFHHSIIDGWSLSLLMGELLDLYTSTLSDTTAPTGPVPGTYRDYVAVEAASRVSAGQRDFWTDYLRDARPYRLPAHWTQAGTRWSEVKLPVRPDRREALTRLAHRAGVPLKHVMLAVHAAVLWMLTGDSPVLTAVFTGGRLEEEHATDIVGMFLNFTPFRLDPRAGTWGLLAAESFAHERRMMPYRRYPLADMEGDLGRGRLTDVAFNYTQFDAYGEMARRKGLRDVRWFEHTHFPLLVNVGYDLDLDRMVITLNGDGRRLSQGRIETLAELYEAVIEEIVDETTPVPAHARKIGKLVGLLTQEGDHR